MKKTKRKLPLPAAAAEPDLSAGSWAPLLLAWYDAHRRDLPWRTPAPRDPYRVWVSEIMLQQTRVETARGYYLRWMEHFPDIASLAAADPDDVLRQWQGLGYYSRARNLQTAAQEIMTRYGGRMPDTRDAIRTLKGIGDYTAGAIASFAFGRREPAVDGNVLRVFARLCKITDNVLSAPVRRTVTELVLAQMPAGRPGDFNEALMDLGATVCIPGTPHCEDCPLTEVCRARALHLETELPLRLVKKEVPVEKVAALFVKSADGRLLIPRRPAKGLLAGMWELPGASVVLPPDAKKSPAARRQALDKACRKLKKLLGRPVTAEPPALASVKHTFSGRIWQIEVYAAVLPDAPDGTNGLPAAPDGTAALPDDTWQWLAPADADQILWAGPYGRLQQKLFPST